MHTKKLLSAVLATSSLFLTGMASAGVVTVQMSPTATNGGAGVVGTTANFGAVGFQSDMSSSLVIANNSGTQPFSETGSINITSFRDAANNLVLSGVNSNYKLYADFTLSGSGTWASSTYTATPGSVIFGVNLHALSSSALTLNLGTASLDPSYPQVAFAVAFGSVAPLSTGTALTSLTATLDFVPNAGFAGPGGFFQSPLSFAFSVGNAGGNTTNTNYSVNNAGQVTFTVPIANTNFGTANATFVSVPEPGALSLVGIALAGLAVVGMRRKNRSAA